MGITIDGGFLSNLSDAWIEALHDDWLKDAGSVPQVWQVFFSGFELGAEKTDRSLNESQALKHSGVQSLIYRYRDLGHLLACTDPLSPCRLEHPLLTLSAFGLDASDLDSFFSSRRYLKPRASLREIVATMRETYCREIGVEFMHIQDPDERQWLIDRMEPNCNRTP